MQALHKSLYLYISYIAKDIETVSENKVHLHFSPTAYIAFCKMKQVYDLRTRKKK